jgi:hypothetical protein
MTNELETNTVQLRYWVFGDNPSSLATIQVANRTTVSALKKAIVSQATNATFQGIPAKTFEVWKVSIPVEDSSDKLAGIILRDNPRDGVERLAPRRQLTSAFPYPPAEDHLHIIVKPPAGECEHFVAQNVRSCTILNSYFLL